MAKKGANGGARAPRAAGAGGPRWIPAPPRPGPPAPRRRLSPGLTLALRVFCQMFPRVWGLTLPVLVPSALGYVLFSALEGGGSVPWLVAYVALLLAGPALVMCLQGSVAFHVHESQRGPSPSFLAAMARGLERFGPVLVFYVVLVLLAGLLFSLAMGLLVALRDRWLHLPVAVVAPPMVLAGLLLLAPVSCVLPVCAVERRSALASLGRASELARGNRFRIVAAMLPVLAADAGATYAVSRAMFALRDPGLAAVLLSALAMSLPLCLTAVAMAAVYCRLKVAEEGNAFVEDSAAFERRWYPG